MPLWGGYAFRPWLFYTCGGEHPATEEYIYRNNHSNAVRSTYNFEPFYEPESKPYLCCEMGGGMFSSYKYRFQLPHESVDAMANIKTASGCNMLGYYMYHGGTNPKGEVVEFLNENQVPKLSYDFQAIIGEYGQVRESYHRLRIFHLFIKSFENFLCNTKTVLPDGVERIQPEDIKTLRFAVRLGKDGAGFLFINNYQDHVSTEAKTGESVVVELPDKTIAIDNISLDAGENCALPFNITIEGIPFRYALAQPLTTLTTEGETYSFFFTPEGMKTVYCFEEGVAVKPEQGTITQGASVIHCPSGEATMFQAEFRGHTLHVVTYTRRQSRNFYRIVLGERTMVILTEGTVLASGSTMRIESPSDRLDISVFPDFKFPSEVHFIPMGKKGIFTNYRLEREKVRIVPLLNKLGPGRYNVNIPPWDHKNIKDIILRIAYMGDIGHAFIAGDMVADNFWNGAIWEIGLREFARRLRDMPLTFYITPLKKETRINTESTMAGQREEFGEAVGHIDSIEAQVVYEWETGCLE
jgi:hypothetical protein